MRTVRTIADLRAELRPARRAERVIGLVPTMGALHEGHLSLIRHARASCDVVVVSLFVNPAQFNAAGDLAAYPRDEERDAALAAEAGADLLFAPTLDEVYPPGFATTVARERPDRDARGRAPRREPLRRRHHRRDQAAEHGRGRTWPSSARRTPSRRSSSARWSAISTCRCASRCCPTVREPDGLALSSRNVHLQGADRERALALRDALAAAEASLGAGERDAEVLRAAALAAMRGRGVEPDYLALVHPDDLSPVARVDGQVLVAVAASVGSTRLIDNTILNANGQPGG